MRRIWVSIILCFTLLLPSIVHAAPAADAIRFSTINVDANGSELSVTVLLDAENNVYINILHFGELTDFQPVELPDGVVRYVRAGQNSVQTARKAFKRVTIIPNEKRIAYTINTVSQNAARFLPLGEVYQVEGNTYVRADLILPLLNTYPLLDGDTLLLLSDDVTMADMMIHLDDYEFDSADTVRDDVLFKSWLAVTNLSERFFSMRIGLPQSDYEDIFESMLTMTASPLEDMDADLIAQMRKDLGLHRNTVMSAFERRNTGFALDQLKMLKKTDTAIKLVDKIFGTNDAAAEVPLSELVAITAHIDTRVNMIRDHYDMLDAAFRLGQGHSWEGASPSTSMKNGARSIWQKYSHHYLAVAAEVAIEKFMDKLGSDAFKQHILGGNGLHSAIVSVSKIVYNEMFDLKLVDTSRKLALLQKYVAISDFAREQIDALCRQEDAISERALEDIRLTATLYLLANRCSYEAMLAAGHTSDKIIPGGGSDIPIEQQHIHRINKALQILALAKGAVANDALANYDQHSQQLREIFSRFDYKPTDRPTPTIHPVLLRLNGIWRVSDMPQDKLKFWIFTPDGEALYSTPISSGNDALVRKRDVVFQDEKLHLMLRDSLLDSFLITDLSDRIYVEETFENIIEDSFYLEPMPVYTNALGWDDPRVGAWVPLDDPFSGLCTYVLPTGYCISLALDIDGALEYRIEDSFTFDFDPNAPTVITSHPWLDGQNGIIEQITFESNSGQLILGDQVYCRFEAVPFDF